MTMPLLAFPHFGVILEQMYQTEDNVTRNRQNAVVCPQVRVCPEHALQLNYRKNKEALKAQRKAQKKAGGKEQRQRKESEDEEQPAGQASESRSSKKQKHADDGEDDDRREPAGQSSKEKHRSQAAERDPAITNAEAEQSHPGAQQDEESCKGKQKHGDGAKLDAEVDYFLREMFP